MKRILSLITCALIAVPCFCKEVKEVKEAKEEKEEYGVAFTLKNGFFYPQEKVLRNIFDRKGSKGGYWIEGAVRYNFWKGLNVEASGSYFKRTGYSLCCPVTCDSTCCSTNCCWPTSCNTGCNTSGCTTCRCGCECTEVKIPTLGLGLKYFWECCDCCEPFIGAGLRVFFYREKNSSSYVVQCVNKTAVGGMINGGIEFDICNGFFIDLFVDYNFSKLNNSCNSCCYPCSTNCNTSCNPCSSTTSCNSCCPSCCFDIHLGGVVGGIGLGYKF